VWGDLDNRWVSQQLRDEIVGFITGWSEKLSLPIRQVLAWFSISPHKFYDWKKRFGIENQSNGALPKCHWLLDCEQEAIIAYAKLHPDAGYRRLTYMMLDADIVAVSPSSTYRVLKPLGLLCHFERKKSKKGTGFIQPNYANEHWHTDISYINISSTFYYFISVLDGYSRMIIHWELMTSMTENDVELVLQKAHEKYPDAKPRIISDNGKQFVANDFQKFIRQKQMTHVTTSPYYPQSNGKIERFHGTLKSECVRKEYLSDLDCAKFILEDYIKTYNYERLHSAIGYVTPWDKFTGKSVNIIKNRYIKLQLAAKHRQAINAKNIEQTTLTDETCT
jgi:transposase InsO family protein